MKHKLQQHISKSKIEKVLQHYICDIQSLLRESVGAPLDLHIHLGDDDESVSLHRNTATMSRVAAGDNHPSGPARNGGKDHARPYLLVSPPATADPLTIVVATAVDAPVRRRRPLRPP